jgi:spermidine/putrescine transport system permease protein
MTEVLDGQMPGLPSRRRPPWRAARTGNRRAPTAHSEDDRRGGSGAERVLGVGALLWLTLTVIAPLAFTVVFSFGRSTFGGVTVGFTLQDYQAALSGFYVRTFLRTLVFAFGGTALTLAIGAPVAYAVAMKAHRLRPILIGALLIPYWTSFLLRTLSWETLLAPGGIVQDIANGLHIHHGQLALLNTQYAVAVGMVYAYLPLAVIPLLVAFQRVPRSILEASKDLGAGRVRTFTSVTLPVVRAGIAASVVLTFVPMTGEFVIPALLGGDKGVLMGGLIYSQYFESANYAVGSAMAVLVLAAIGLVLAVVLRFTKGLGGIIA